MSKQNIVALVAALSWILVAVEPGAVDTASLKHIANITYAADSSNLNGVATVFSPRMDFDQWKPLTGRGDPLRNDPTYDYEPPVLERVHYWADDTRLEREHYPDRKSEVLMLGVSSRKPSVGPRQPLPPRRHHRPPPPKYEDFSYKLSDHFPMTILVPPPPPPPGHKPSLYILDNKQIPNNSQTKVTDAPKIVKDVTPEHLTSLYALQESNLIYQSSTTSHNWVFNHTQTLPNTSVSSDYAGWGPTTPIDEVEAPNDTHNFIFNDQNDFSKQPYSFYKPMFSEAPPPPQVTTNPLLLPTFIPTALPSSSSPETQRTATVTQETWPPERTTTESFTDIIDYNEEITTDTNKNHVLQTTPMEFPRPQTNKSILDMLNPMMSMPMVNDPERPEDNYYAHASENVHVFKEHPVEDTMKLETMQTMQPPPVAKYADTTMSHKQPFHVSTNSLHKTPTMHTHDPYLHMRFTTPTTITSPIPSSENTKSTTETPTVPMYLIIQGHSKVKTYGSKPTPVDASHTINNEIPKPNETDEVKHLHPIKEKYSSQKSEKSDLRRSRANNLKSLVDEGRGSIEIQETDIGIKYDVSDGSEVPLETYRKGIVANDINENDYSKAKKQNRSRRQVGLEDILPFDEDKIEEYVFNFLKGRQNETGITGLIAQAVTGIDMSAAPARRRRRRFCRAAAAAKTHRRAE